MPLLIADAYFIAIGVEVFLHGMYTALWLVSMYLLLEKTKVIVVMTVLNSIMWTVATSHMAISFQQNFDAFLHNHAADNPVAFEDNSAPNIYLQILLECINIVIGDGIVIWRAWILWNRERWVIFTTATLLTGTVTGAIGLIRVYTMAPPGITLFENPSLSAWATAFIGSTLITNIWATSLVAYRTWSHNKFIRAVTGERFMNRIRRQNGILPILIESGVFYCCTWFVAIISFVCGNNFIYIVIDILSQLTAIYPTLIITLVCLRSTLDVAIETFQRTTQECAARADNAGNRNHIITTTSYPLSDFRVAVRTTAHSSGFAPSDAISRVGESTMNSDEPSHVPCEDSLGNMRKTEDKMNIV
ncbi:uncharacterized protein EV420DRAFT_741017 [Desarmillaria tabescens]|uniref:Uncharacterized protein n=1 Tax=Armillaria tabescens TaxID=1929756 RepID=A0AA39JXJ1_ARMTA|nr:uncharacterized protein EV420DRAFT_741017 [Desarmillaria tabescens]KAK0450578.1 hypothetical protein EV420DRAFT_741017 [Desarmillaria tabescens]